MTPGMQFRLWLRGAARSQVMVTFAALATVVTLLVMSVSQGSSKGNTDALFDPGTTTTGTAVGGGTSSSGGAGTGAARTTGVGVTGAGAPGTTGTNRTTTGAVIGTGGTTGSVGTTGGGSASTGTTISGQGFDLTRVRSPRSRCTDRARRMAASSCTRWSGTPAAPAAAPRGHCMWAPADAGDSC